MEDKITFNELRVGDNITVNIVNTIPRLAKKYNGTVNWINDNFLNLKILNGNITLDKKWITGIVRHI